MKREWGSKGEVPRRQSPGRRGRRGWEGREGGRKDDSCSLS